VGKYKDRLKEKIFVLALDNDRAGKKAAGEFLEGMRELWG